MRRRYVTTARIFTLALAAGGVFFGIRAVFAAAAVDPGGELGGVSNAIQVSDPSLQRIEQRGNVSAEERFREYMSNLSLSSRLFQTTLRTALNSLAFDMANWVASGASGQSAAFETRSLGRVFTDAMDAAAGDFLSTLGSEGLGGFNMCDPQLLDLNIKIGLGLTQYQRPTPECTFSELRNNWERELQSLNFLRDFQSYFEVSSNDAGIALSTQSAFLQAINKDAADAVRETQYGEGWKLDVGRLIDDDTVTTPPGALRASFEQQAIRNLNADIGKFTGDALIDALNIFINQLAIQLVNNLLRGGLFGSEGIGRPAGVAYNPNADPSASGGIQAAQEHLRKIKQPRFDVRGDYSILSELSTCPDPNHAGPTNCVLLNTFRQAIQERKTVGEAMDEGLLNADGIFGFEAQDQEPSFVNENYPYRSMIILRKFRILPVGWEVGASYVNEHFNESELAKGVYTLKDMVECFYTGEDDQYPGVNEPWCRGLVDPDWVLKAPLNYCAREGYGPETFDTDDAAGRVVRRDNYCADEQACIKENSDGSCEVYGYCTEERRTWNFGADSCEPVYNTCQTFRSQEGGQTASYLKNTLSWCKESDVGCRSYDLVGTYQPAENGQAAYVDWANNSYAGNGANVVRSLNKNTEACDARSEGCTEFIRASADLGTNLVYNGSFETVEGDAPVGWNNGTAVVEDSVEGSRVLSLTNASASQSLSGLTLFDETTYILSLQVKNEGSTDAVTVSVGGTKRLAVNDVPDSWERFNARFTVTNGPINAPTLRVTVTGGEVLVDAVQLEMVTTAENPAPYSDYRANAVHQKLLPEYLIDHSNDSNNNTPGDAYEGVCYDETGNLKTDAPAVCDNFTRMCREEEIGCTLYTRTRDGFAVPGTVKYSTDETESGYCPSECDGYDKYVQRATDFENETTRNLIPATGQTCSAAAVGCEQFTNLDEVAQGGEGIEYYSQLRQCTADSSDQKGFYTWEGSEDTGFQLRVFALQDVRTDNTDNNGDAFSNDSPPDDRPDVTKGYITDNGEHVIDDVTVCNEEIFNADIKTNADIYNPDCRQVYAREGTLTYVLFSDVIFYSTDCHPYRLSTDYGEEKCTASGGEYNDNNECVYMAIPQQGVQCSAAQLGCREYVGNTGGNERVILAHDFEDGGLAGWEHAPTDNNNNTQITIANRSLRANGKSLTIISNSNPAEAVVDVSNNVRPGKTYAINVVAGMDNWNNSYDVALVAGEGGSQKPYSFQFTGNEGEWRLFEDNVTIPADAPVQPIWLRIQVKNDDTAMYIDSITLRELTDTYYLVKNSWQTPESCVVEDGSPFVTAAFWEDKNDPPVEDDGIHLGCYEYRTQNGQTAYIKDFDSLCSESAVGCELMIDTANYTPPGEGSWEDGGITVPADAYRSVVYNPAKSCDASAKGCMLAGQKQGDDTYDSVYIENNPDIYDRALCDAAVEGCTAWRTPSGEAAYFKDPGKQTCEYRDGYFGERWYQTPTAYCDLDLSGSIENSNGDGDNEELPANGCTSDAQCGENIACVTWDVQCDTDRDSVPKTIGYGGAGNRIEQPEGGFAGLCPTAQSSCTEVIDPVSESSVNLLDGTDNKQVVDLKQNTLYRGSAQLSIQSNDSNNGRYYYLDETANTLVSQKPDDSNTRWFVFSADNTNIEVDPNSGTTNTSLRRAIVNYQLADTLDFSGCNSRVDESEGCVLFNVRGAAGNNGALAYSPLRFNADQTDGAADRQNVPANCSAADGECDANQVLQVQPDRVCSEWLACRSSAVIRNEENGEDERVCYDVGTCDGLNDANQCRSWVFDAEPQNQSVTVTGAGSNTQDYLNATGYVKVGLDSGHQREAQGYIPFGEMQQRGGLIVVPNGGFERTSGFNAPFSWSVKKYVGSYAGAVAVVDDVSENRVSTIDNAQEAQAFDIKYPIEGSHFLALGTDYLLDSQVPLEVAPNTDYTLSFQVNTLSLSSEQMEIQVRANNANHSLIASGGQAAGLDWQKRFIRFNSGDHNRIILVITPHTDSNNAPLGTMFVDDIKIRPTLYVQNYNTNNNEWQLAQSCRLYPQADALTCQYTDEEGVQQRGWYGYCLQYDRAPVGDPNACLLWYPVDRVKGDSINEQVPSYAGRAPLYYCAETESRRYIAIPDRLKNIRMRARIGCSSPDDNGYFTNLDYELLTNPQTGETTYYPKHAAYPPTSNPNVPGYGKVGGTASNVELRLEAQPAFTIGGVDYYDFSKVALLRHVKTDCNPPDSSNWQITTGLDELTVSSCVRLVATVDAIGQNKAWSTRVQQGTPHSVPGCYDAVTKQNETECGYHIDMAPFGALAYPAPPDEPSLWSSKSGPKNVPLLAEDINYDLSYPYQARFRYSYDYAPPSTNITDLDGTQGGSTLMSVFAKSYGSWSWQNGGSNGVCQAEGVCSNDNTTSCNINDNNASNGENSSCIFSSDQNTCELAASCVGGAMNGQSCTPSADGACTPPASYCLDAGICSRSTGKPNTSCSRDKDAENYYLNVCWDEDPRGTCIQEDSGTCRYTGDECTKNDECLTSTGFCVSECAEGVVGSACTTDVQCRTSGSGYRKDPPDSQISWDLPNTSCTNGDNHEPGSTDYCAIPPTIDNITVNNAETEIVVHLSNASPQAKFEFNANADDDQLPIVEVRIDWGDGTQTSVTGMRMRDRINEERPFTFYHVYTYNDLFNKNSSSDTVWCKNDTLPSGFSVPATVGNDPYCLTRPSVWVRDNWGWYSDGSERDTPPETGTQGNWVVVTQ